MSCLSLRLPPAKKAWKSFTSKLQTKLLHKLNKSKAIKKHKNRFPITKTAAKPIKASPFLDRHVGRKKRLHSNHQHCRYHQKKKYVPPVYVDKLFKEPTLCEVVERKCTPANSRNIKVPGHEAVVTGAVSEERGDRVEGASRRSVADDMWESVGLTSPQMHGINERAENFIVRFRAEMELQELIARDS